MPPMSAWWPRLGGEGWGEMEGRAVDGEGVHARERVRARAQTHMHTRTHTHAPPHTHTAPPPGHEEHDAAALYKA